ncbi:hypothetical protein CC86DRAFT_92679 [Ophiobolus disseminans]|uniref:F-box domain-containing protein n=1 Tax=Ophiobolus disseminans TaxID=1469910 RepID=A0A6A7AHI3_9PLEO|nr:hypothetical protein CC86DRAFT_92679 [Ophiobolus disseminans]
MSTSIGVTITSDVSANKTSNSSAAPLLRLSGELRNRIYHFAQEAKPLFIIPPMKRDESILPGQSSSSTQRPQYQGLMQTCRQLRAEFRPIYRAQTVHHLYPVHVAAYISTFLRRSDEKMDTVVDNVVLDIHQQQLDMPATNDFSILPLIRFCYDLNRTPHANCRLRVRVQTCAADLSDIPGDELTQLFRFAHEPILAGSVSPEPRWESYIRHAIKDIQLTIIAKANIICVDVQLTPEYPVDKDLYERGVWKQVTDCEFDLWYCDTLDWEGYFGMKLKGTFGRIYYAETA